MPDRYVVDVGDDPGPEPREDSHLERAQAEIDRERRWMAWTDAGEVDMRDIRADAKRDA
jgi:hypothetical protein